MKSFTGKFTSVRGWALLLALLLGAGMMITACGDEEVPAPTTPAPTPPPAPPPAPEPEPEPEPPAVPTGLRVSATGMDFIEWSWTPVEDVSGYDVQFSANEAFTDEDEITARTAEEISYRQDGLEAGTSGYLRVRSATGADDDRITSDWSTHVTGMTMEAPPPPAPPATPTGLMVSGTTETSITWTWNEVEGATGYVVQASTDEMFDATETVLFDGMPYTTETSYTASDLEADTTLYVRVAAAAGTVEAPLVSAFTTHVTGMTMAATLGTPSDVRVKSKGSDYIEWEWDEVAGADGYQAHFSTDSGFSDSHTFERPGGSNTTVRVSRLEPESDGYFRVRAYSGTVTARVFGDWSEADMATTEEPPPPPPAEPLDAPANVGTSNAQDNSITVSWDEVDDAEEYAVQQRSNGGAWVDARCGSETAGNIVSDTSCVASGLDEDTPYDFRVRAFPDSGDDTLTQSAWSDIASGETTGEAPPPPITGGDDGLNVQWTSTGETASDSDDATITWNWDPVPDRANRQRIDHLVWLTAETECADIMSISEAAASPTLTTVTFTNGAWHNLKANISATVGSLGNGDVQTLCVVRTWEDELADGLSVRRYGTPEVVRAATPPAVATTLPAVTNHPTTRLSTGLAWHYVMDPGFDYPGRLVSARRTGSAPTAMDCGSGDSVSSRPRVTTADVDETHDVSNPTPYSYFRFCIRAENDDGRSKWVTVGDALQTRPTAPNRPAYDSGESAVTQEDWGGDALTKIAWSVAEDSDTPRTYANHDVKVFRSTQSSISANATQTVCETPSTTNVEGYVALTHAGRNRGMGIEISASEASPGAGLLGTAPDEYYFYTCVRANPDLSSTNSDNEDHGAWAISSARKFIGGRPPDALSANGATAATATRALDFSWSAVTDTTAQYHIEYVLGSTISDSTPSRSRVNVSPSTATTRTVSGLTAGGAYAWRVRYSVSVGGRRLYSVWTNGTANASN